MQFSVLMSVYKNEKVEYFKVAIDSVLNQTVRPNEIVLIRDGEVYEELQLAIDEYISEYPELFTYIPLEQNGGLGNALKIGSEICKYELVARMDTDDICVSDRFEKQLKCFEENPFLDMVGGNISEFLDDPNNVIDYRCVPKTHEEIIERMKSRSPFNHMTVMFKKQAVLDAGNYQPFYLLEDWYLWVRMFLNEQRFYNIQDVLVNVRISGMADRRGGGKYYKSCKKMLRFMLDNKVIEKTAYFKLKMIRFCGHVVLPSKMRKWAYERFLRSKKNTKSVKTEIVEPKM